MKKVFILFLLLLYEFTAFTQIDFDAFENYSIYDGLPNPGITAIIQDSRGFLWFGTYDGLSRFDGYTFINYRKQEEDTHSLPDNWVTALFVDSRNILWVGTQNGLATYDPISNIFRKYSFIEELPGHPNSNYITDIKETRDGNIWIFTVYGFYRYSQFTGKSVFYLPDPADSYSSPDTLIHASFIDSEGRFWLSFWHKGLYQVILKDNKVVFEPFYLNKNNSVFSGDITRVSAFSEDRDGNIWLGLYNRGLLKLDPVTGKALAFFYHQPDNLRSLSDNRIKSVFWEDDHRVWVGFDEKELNLLDPMRNMTIRIIPEYKRMSGVKADFTCCIYRDNNGSLWFGTRFNGVNKLSDKVNLFTHILNIKSDPGSLPENDVRSFCQIDSCLWVGMNKGYLSAFNLRTNAIIRNLHIPQCHSIRDIEYAGKDELWLGTYACGLMRYNYKTGHAKYFSNPEIRNEPVFSLLPVENGIWFRSSGHLNFLNYETEKILSFYLHETHIPSINRPRQVCYSLARSDNGFIWTNSINEIFSFNPAEYTRATYLLDSVHKRNIQINTFILDRNRLWIGTNLGLYEMNLATSVIQHHVLNNDFLFNDIQGIVYDKHRKFWLTTVAGIMMYDNKAGTSTLYNAKLFIQNTYFNPSAVYYTTNGSVIMGGRNGFNLFYPERMDDFKTQSSLVITSIKVNNAGYTTPETQNAAYIDQMKLRHDQNNLSFEFALLNYNFPEYTNYACFLEGFDSEWIFLGNKHSVSYINLPPGHYIFKVKANSYEGVWSSEVSLPVEIRNPYWKTWWFYFVLLLALFALLYLFIMIRTRSIERINEKLKHLVQERTVEILAQKEELRKLNLSKDKLFSIIGHDLKNPFNAISGFSRLLIDNFDVYPRDKQLEILRIMQNSTDNILELLDNILDWSRANTDKIKFKPVQCIISELVDKACEHLKFSAGNKNIRLVNNTTNDTVFVDVDMITTALRNIISNGIKFTMPGGQVVISCQTNKHTAEIRISDSGIGIRPEVLSRLFVVDKHFSTEGTMGETGTGIGLILAKEFIERNNGSISVESTPGIGTTFCVKLPVNMN